MLVIAGTKLGLGSHYESTFLYLNRTELESPSNLLGEGGLGGGVAANSARASFETGTRL